MTKKKSLQTTMLMFLVRLRLTFVDLSKELKRRVKAEVKAKIKNAKQLLRQMKKHREPHQSYQLHPRVQKLNRKLTVSQRNYCQDAKVRKCLDLENSLLNKE